MAEEYPWLRNVVIADSLNPFNTSYHVYSIVNQLSSLYSVLMLFLVFKVIVDGSRIDIHDPCSLCVPLGSFYWPISLAHVYFLSGVQSSIRKFKHWPSIMEANFTTSTT